MNKLEIKGEKQMKKESGITLIALIITIIVLIILAMVSVRIITDQDIIHHAENAAEMYKEKQENEIEQLNLVEQELDKHATETKEWWEPTEEEFKSMLDVEDDVRYVAVKTENGELTTAVALGHDNNNVFGIMIMQIENETLLSYLIEENISEELKNSPSVNIKENKQWYVARSGSEPLYQTNKYTGSSPIQLSDFEGEGGTIYCQSYLERVIASFEG